jgi:multicomponent K+:H+ antiporter subunit A
MTPLIRIVSLAVLPIALLISLAHLLGAESGPGDGFTAGIISALGLTVEYLAFGYEEARRRLRRLEFHKLLFAGVFLALVATVLPLFAGEPVLGTVALRVAVPGLGELGLSRALLLDVGIYLAVVGGAMTAIDSLEEVAR